MLRPVAQMISIYEKNCCTYETDCGLPFVRCVCHVFGIAGELNGKFWHASLVDESDESEILLTISNKSSLNRLQHLYLEI